MTTVYVKAKSALHHDSLKLTRGEVGKCSAAAAEDLRERGLVEIVEKTDSAGMAVSAGPTAADEKEAPPLDNKMAPAPASKARK